MINPADAALGRGTVRRDDIVADVINVRRRQDIVAANLRIPPAPDIRRLREAAAVRAEFKELFADLELAQPQPRSDGNAVGEKIAHLRALQRLAPGDWPDVNLGRLAQTSADVFDVAEAEIVGAAKALAADPAAGSIHRPGALRPTVRTDAAGRKTTTWHGNPNAWMNAFKSPAIDCLNAIGDGRGGWWPR